MTDIKTQCTVNVEHTLPALPYAMYALAPHMSQETFDYLYAKHHLAYLVNLNKLIKGTDFDRNLRPKFVENFLNNLVNWVFAVKNYA